MLDGGIYPRNIPRMAKKKNSFSHAPTGGVLFGDFNRRVPILSQRQNWELLPIEWALNLISHKTAKRRHILLLPVLDLSLHHLQLRRLHLLHIHLHSGLGDRATAPAITVRIHGRGLGHLIVVRVVHGWFLIGDLIVAPREGDRPPLFGSSRLHESP
jgi:hypothetical protein